MNNATSENSPRDTDGAGAGDESRGGELRAKVIEALKTCYDPEIPVDIYELGMVYNIDITPDAHVIITMTLTSPACPVAESLPSQVETTVAAVEGVAAAKVDLTWEPPWSPEMMSEAARLTLNM